MCHGHSVLGKNGPISQPCAQQRGLKRPACSSNGGHPVGVNNPWVSTPKRSRDSSRAVLRHTQEVAASRTTIHTAQPRVYEGQGHGSSASGSTRDNGTSSLLVGNNRRAKFPADSAEGRVEAFGQQQQSCGGREHLVTKESLVEKIVDHGMVCVLGKQVAGDQRRKGKPSRVSEAGALTATTGERVTVPRIGEPQDLKPSHDRIKLPILQSKRSRETIDQGSACQQDEQIADGKHGREGFEAFSREEASAVEEPIVSSIRGGKARCRREPSTGTEHSAAVGGVGEKTVDRGKRSQKAENIVGLRKEREGGAEGDMGGRMPMAEVPVIASARTEDAKCRQQPYRRSKRRVAEGCSIEDSVTRAETCQNKVVISSQEQAVSLTSTQKIAPVMKKRMVTRSTARM